MLIAEDGKVVTVGDGDCEDETIKRSPLTSKTLNRVTSYLTLKASLAFTQIKKTFT